MFKHFDPELYAANDKRAKDKVIEVFKEQGIKLKENENKKEVDLLILDKKNKHVGNIEVEIKNVWKGTYFPFDSVQFPERKAKYAKLDKPTHFVMFNKELTRYLIVKDTDLLDSPLAMVRNKYVTHGENFYQVPLDKVTFYHCK